MNHTTWCDTCALVHSEKKGTFMCFCECHNVDNRYLNSLTSEEQAKQNEVHVTAVVTTTTDTADNTPDQLISILRNHVGETGESEDAVEVLLRLLKEHKCPLVASTDTSEWRERFDKEIGYCTRIECIDRDDIKAFIENELERVRAEGYTNGREDKRNQGDAHREAFSAGKAEERARVRELIAELQHKRPLYTAALTALLDAFKD